MYVRNTSSSYDGLGAFDGLGAHEAAEKTADLRSVLATKAPEFREIDAMRFVLGRGTGPKRKRKEASDIAGKLFWTASGPRVGQRIIMGGKEPEKVSPPTKPIVPRAKIIRDMPVLDLPPVSLSGFGEISLSKGCGGLVVLGLMLIALYAYNANR